MRQNLAVSTCRILSLEAYEDAPAHALRICEYMYVHILNTFTAKC